MRVKVNAKRQVIVPGEILDALGVKPGDIVEIEQGPDGISLRCELDGESVRDTVEAGEGSGHIDHSTLAPLRDKIDPTAGPFDIREFRDKHYHT